MRTTFALLLSTLTSLSLASAGSVSSSGTLYERDASPNSLNPDLLLGALYARGYYEPYNDDILELLAARSPELAETLEVRSPQPPYAPHASPYNLRSKGDPTQGQEGVPPGRLAKPRKLLKNGGGMGRSKGSTRGGGQGDGTED